jgi:hypothetical protein
MTSACSSRVRLSGFAHSPQALTWGSSGFGVLLHLARVNHLHRRRDISQAFGILGPNDDLSWVLTFDARRRARFCDAIEHTPSDPAYWGMPAWQPFETFGPWRETNWRLRGCPTCFRNAFHTNLFQCPWVVRCPWHRDALIDACRRCGRQLLAGVASGLPLLVCRCGWDAVSVTAALLEPRFSEVEERQKFLQAYAEWTRKRLDERVFLHPESTSLGLDQALSAVVRCPPELKAWSTAFSTGSAGCHIEHWGFTADEMERVSRFDTRKLAEFVDKLADGALAFLPWSGASLSSILVRQMCRVLRQDVAHGFRDAGAEDEFIRIRTFARSRLDGAAAQLDPCVLNLATRDALFRQLTRLLQLRERGTLWWPAKALHQLCERLVNGAYADGVGRALSPLLRGTTRGVNWNCARLPWMLIHAPAMGRQDVSIAWTGGVMLG